MIRGACAIFLRDGRLLLARRSPLKRFYPDCWDRIGGHVEPGETIEQALVRECREEVGVEPARFGPAGRVTLPEATAVAEATYHVFRVTQWRGGEPRMLGDEHTEIGWFTVEEACTLEGLALAVYPALFRRLALRR